MNRTARIHAPGLGTYLTHLAILMALVVVWGPLAFLRMIVAPFAELLIAATDYLFDTIVERLYR